MSKRKAKCQSDLFCYICGLYTPNHQRSITPIVKERYDKYFFPVRLGDQDKSFAPHIICSNCFDILSKWAQGSADRKRYFPFDWPMSWREPTNHESDCYFCCTNTKGMRSKYRKTINYAEVQSVTVVEGCGNRKPSCSLQLIV